MLIKNSIIDQISSFQIYDCELYNSGIYSGYVGTTDRYNMNIVIFSFSDNIIFKNIKKDKAYKDKNTTNIFRGWVNE